MTAKAIKNIHNASIMKLISLYDHFWFLCLIMNISGIIVNIPPTSSNRWSIDSGIRRLSFLALRLSAQKRMVAMRFIIIRYIIASFMLCENLSAIKNKRVRISELFVWYLLELNQGHQDFQSCALPTELRYQSILRMQRYVKFWNWQNFISKICWFFWARSKVRWFTESWLSFDKFIEHTLCLINRKSKT